MGEYIEREAFIEAKRKQYCADCDRRKGMKNGKMRFCYEIGEAPCRACYVDDLLTDVEDFPAADVVEVRHGRWISDSPGKRFGTVVRLDKDGCPVGSCHCSECGEWLTASDEYPVIGYYCPNCGAKMTEDHREQKE